MILFQNQVTEKLNILVQSNILLKIFFSFYFQMVSITGIEINLNIFLQKVLDVCIMTSLVLSDSN